MEKLNKETNILIATFSLWKDKKRTSLNGNLEPLLDFFIPKVNKTVLIDQPYPGSDTLLPRIEIYEKGKKQISHSSFFISLLYPFLKVVNYNATHPSFKIRDFLSVLDWVFRDKTIFDYLVGFEAINTCAGILLRRLGKIKVIIYYVSDYSPNRYSIKIMNTFYLWLDRFCAMHADVIWDVSKAMQPARIKAGLAVRKSAPVLVVPNALYPTQIKQASLEDVIPNSLVFMGTLGPENGPDIAIKALPYVLKKIPKAKLHIVGGGDADITRLRNLADKLNVNNNTVFHGYIFEREKISQLIRTFSLALAPYPIIFGSPRLYGDATKIRAYLAAGLPVITTIVPPLGREVADYGAALRVADTPGEFSKAIIRILSSKKLYLSMRKKAIEFAKENTWENEFKKAFVKMETMSF